MVHVRGFIEQNECEIEQNTCKNNEQVNLYKLIRNLKCTVTLTI